MCGFGHFLEPLFYSRQNVNDSFAFPSRVGRIYTFQLSGIPICAHPELGRQPVYISGAATDIFWSAILPLVAMRTLPMSTHWCILFLWYYGVTMSADLILVCRRVSRVHIGVTADKFPLEHIFLIALISIQSCISWRKSRTLSVTRSSSIYLAPPERKTLARNRGIGES